MKYFTSIGFFCLMAIALSCATKQETNETVVKDTDMQDTFQYKIDQFADLAIYRYQVPGFDQLSSKQKELVYYLYEAALSGRDMIYDQNYKHNLQIRKTIETIVSSYKGDKNNQEYDKFLEYAKRVWFSNGIHHHYSTKKLKPGFTKEYFADLVKNSTGNFPLKAGESKEQLVSKLTPVLFDPSVDAKRVNIDEGADLVAHSANNLYEGVTQKEVEDYYAKLVNKEDKQPISYGLNSRMSKKDGKVVEEVYKVGGLYSPAIERIVYWLKKASTVAENSNQKAAIDKLIEYYQTGDLKKFDEYNIAWVKDTASVVDVVNGFIEVYGDAMGYRGAYESVVSIKDMEASKRMAAIAANAQWFEDNAPILDAHKKKKVSGITYKVITVVAEAGDAAPSTPIGINLPNADWIRKEHGSKSVSLGNIEEAYSKASSGKTIDEFAYNEEERNRDKQYGVLADNLHTALHEVIGHASGQLAPGVSSGPETLKNYYSTLEEARADLVALYYLMDQKMVDLGQMPSLEVGKAAYDDYIRNGMMLQLRRVGDDENIEEAHMRNRQLVAAWVFEKGQKDNVIEKTSKGGKTFFVVHDYEKLRSLFGDLLREIQRIKSEGDFAAGKALVEKYGVKVDRAMQKEVKERYAKLQAAPYAGFIQPKLIPVMEGESIKDVKIEYPKDFVQQMLEYGKEYSFL